MSEGGNRDQGGRSGVAEVRLTSEPVEESRETEPGTERAAGRPRSEHPFGILLVGDFRGTGIGASSGGLRTFRERDPVAVDRDDLDRVLASFRPSVQLAGDDGEPSLSLEFGSIEDFHPDHLLERVPLLGMLREERERLREGEEGGGAAGNRTPGHGETPSGDRTRGASGADRPSGSPADTNGGLLDQVIASTPGSGEGPVEDPPAHRKESALQEFIRKAVEPHRVEGPDAGVERALEALDQERARQLRRLLHHPRFQTMEARWRGLELLVRRLETGPDLKVFLLQADRSELLRAAAVGELQDRLALSSESALGGAPWALAVLDHAFGARAVDLVALEAIARAGEALGTAFVGEVDPSLLDVRSAEEGGAELESAWTELRSHPGARHIGLLLPRFLLREPYAPGENPVESMSFRELAVGSTPDPRDLLWAHGGILAAILLGTAFRRSGWDFDSGAIRRVDGLPIALHPGGEGTVALPSTEIPLDGSSIRELVEAGFMPLAGRIGEGRVEIATFRSLSGTGEGLRGPWG